MQKKNPKSSSIEKRPFVDKFQIRIKWYPFYFEKINFQEPYTNCKNDSSKIPQELVGHIKKRRVIEIKKTQKNDSKNINYKERKESD